MSIIEHALRKFQDVRHEKPGVPLPPARLGSLRESPADANGSHAVTTPARRIVQLDRAALVGAGFMPPPENQRQMADQFRHAKRPLLDAALGRGVETLPEGCKIMVTSSVPNEGKTFISFNLAVSMALESDVNVVLVDADVAKQHISQLFGIECEPGLLDAIRDESVDIESLVLPTSFPNLSVLPAGKADDTATELLASHRMEAVVAKLGVGMDRRRIVVLDSPPLLLTSESRALARHVGQIVLVVRAGLTPQQVVRDALDCIDRDRAIRLILNQSESMNEAGYYYHDSVYGYYSRGQNAHLPEGKK
jgi:exopolysaccharide/PEP-CTERM locus tyrosine autokinase